MEIWAGEGRRGLPRWCGCVHGSRVPSREEGAHGEEGRDPHRPARRERDVHAAAGGHPRRPGARGRDEAVTLSGRRLARSKYVSC